VFVVIISIGLMIVITRHISTRINSMIAVAETIAQGNFNIRLKDDTGDEMSGLSRSLNSMTKAVEESFSKLEKSKVDLEDANKELEKFAYVASHDLKEPVRMISNYTQLLELQYAGQLDKTGQEYVKFAVDGSHRIRALINDLLAYVELTQRPVQPEDIDLNRVVNEAVKNLAKESRISTDCISITSLPNVKADTYKIYLLFYHLLDNAFKFRRQDAKPCIKMNVEKQDRNYLFSISDEGIGMDMDYKEKVFTIFQRLHNKDDYSGNGIGLTLCKKIVEMHGGKIWLNSLPSVGTTVYFTLPDVV
jgi:light-regulated signal transduction histidine kinase (bacteriophytochrome)